MYFTSLPDHATPGFDEQRHFSQFEKHNVIFNAISNNSHCDKHAGCLSIKTVLSGEEWYGVNGGGLIVRPGQFLILNHEQSYACRVDKPGTHTVSVFFRKEFAQSVFRDLVHAEENLLDNPFDPGNVTPEFFQTLNQIDTDLQSSLARLLEGLDNKTYDSQLVDEHLIFLLNGLIRSHRLNISRAVQVKALKSSTRKEVYKRICIAKDVIHSNYMLKPSLDELSASAGISVPQLVRQFKAAFYLTPHQYLMEVRLAHAARLLQENNTPVHEASWMCGFENQSAFCRAFKSRYGVQPGKFR